MAGTLTKANASAGLSVPAHQPDTDALYRSLLSPSQSPEVPLATTAAAGVECQRGSRPRARPERGGVAIA